MVKKLHDILEKKVGSDITKQFAKHEDLIKAKEDFEKSGSLIKLHASDILEDYTFQIRSEKVASEDFENLKASLKANGQQIPILVRKKGEKYQIIGGFNRTQALKDLKMPILAIFKDVDDDTAEKISELENIQRIGLSFTDMFNRIKKLKEKGLTNDQISERLNKGKRIIQYYMQIGENVPLSSLIKKQVISFKEAIKLSHMPEKDMAKKIGELESLNNSADDKKKVKKTVAVKIKEVVIDKTKNIVKISISDKLENKDKVIKKLQEIITELKNI